MGLAESIVQVALSHRGSKKWLHGKAKDDFPAGKDKCNKFVYDVLVEAGVEPPPLVAQFIVFSRPPLAGEWADPAAEITGWKVVADPKPGDVAAIAISGGVATGHVAIVVGDRQTVSAASTQAGAVVMNDWGFRPGQNPTFRRCNYPGGPGTGRGVKDRRPHPARKASHIA